MGCKTFFLVLLCGLTTEGRTSYGGPSYNDRSLKATWRRTAVANRHFAHRLYAKVARNTDSPNLMISPYVVSSAMSMALLGARGRTEQEIMQTLEYADIGRKKNGEPYTKHDVPKLYENLHEKAREGSSGGSNKFTVANKLYGQETEPFLPEFIRDTETYYNAKFEAVDFASNSAEARRQINDWVSNKTEGVITEALPAGTVGPDTLLALVSTAYFKGEWKNKFDPDDTYTGPFTKLDGTSMETQFMRGTFSLKYRHSSRLQSEILVLPYKTTSRQYDVEMQLILPRRTHMLSVIEQLQESDYHQAMRNLQPHIIDLHFPKFRMEYEIDLANSLSSLGMRSLFQETADLSGMNGRRNLFLSNAIHKSFIEVNEEGTIAGSSLASALTRSPHIFKLRFDRPFVFLIVEKTTRSILFMGRVGQPN